jgi:hypothetical protein
MISAPLLQPAIGTPLRSFEGYALPHLVDVSAGRRRAVTSLLVSPHDVVRRGQTVALVEPVSPGHDGCEVKAPVAGLVIRCCAATGQPLAGNWPILTIASSENLLVVARFAPGNLSRIRHGDTATVRFGGGEGVALAARIVSAVEAPDPDPSADGRDGRSIRVVLSVPDAPPKALWPGTPARVAIEPC